MGTRDASWDEGLGTGVESIDVEHRLQVSVVDALEELLRRGGDATLAAATLAQLVELTNVHFLSEELLMRLYSYPQHDAHVLEHARLVEQVERIQRELAAGGASAALDTIATLREWLANHIRSMDQGFALWCARNRIRPA